MTWAHFDIRQFELYNILPNCYILKNNSWTCNSVNIFKIKNTVISAWLTELLAGANTSETNQLCLMEGDELEKKLGFVENFTLGGIAAIVSQNCRSSSRARQASHPKPE